VIPELASRGHQVTGISTHPENAPVMDGVTSVEGNIDDRAKITELLKGHDVVVSSVQFTKYDHEKLIGAVKDSGVGRYFVCGGSGTLHAPGTSTRIMDTPNFPAGAMPFATSAASYFERLQAETDLNWTYVSPPPPPGFAPGVRTGRYRLGKDEVLVGPDGKLGISYEDYASVIADELSDPKHRGRFTVGY